MCTCECACALARLSLACRRRAATTIPEAGNSSVSFHPDDDLPEVGPPGRDNVLIVGVNRLNTSNFHALLRTFRVKLNLTILKRDCICKDGVVKES